MLEILTGTGLATAAGLNAYIPLLLVGLVARFTDLLHLDPTWQWLEHPATLVTLGALLVVELVADKIPAVDSVNDAVQTFVRPTAGGITFGAGSSAYTLDAGTVAATSDGGSLWPVVAGALVALGFHALKSLARPVLNALSFGLAAPVASVTEDVSSLGIALLAIVVPIVVVLLLPVVVVLTLLVVRARRRRRSGEREREAPTAHDPPESG